MSRDAPRLRRLPVHVHAKAELAIGRNVGRARVAAELGQDAGQGVHLAQVDVAQHQLIAEQEDVVRHPAGVPASGHDARHAGEHRIGRHEHEGVLDVLWMTDQAAVAGVVEPVFDDLERLVEDVERSDLRLLGLVPGEDVLLEEPAHVVLLTLGQGPDPVEHRRHRCHRRAAGRGAPIELRDVSLVEDRPGRQRRVPRVERGDLVQVGEVDELVAVVVDAVKGVEVRDGGEVGLIWREAEHGRIAAGERSVRHVGTRTALRLVLRLEQPGHQHEHRKEKPQDHGTAQGASTIGTPQIDPTGRSGLCHGCEALAHRLQDISRPRSTRIIPSGARCARAVFRPARHWLPTKKRRVRMNSAPQQPDRPTTC